MTFGRYPYGGVGYGAADVAEIPDQAETSLSVEIAFTTGALETPVWEDVTGDVRSWDVQRGRRRELERYQPGRATVELSNRSRAYDSEYSSGPHFGDIKPMRRIRIRETFNGVTYPIFDGFIDSWKLEYPNSGKDAISVVNATDGFKVLNRTDLPRSVYDIEVAADSPVLWWRFDELKNHASDTDIVARNYGSLGTDGDATYVGPPELGGEPLVVNDPAASMMGYSSAEVTGVGDMGATLAASAFDLLTNDVWVMEAWVIPRLNIQNAIMSLMRIGDGSDPPCRVEINNVAGTVEFDFFFDNGVGGSSGRFEDVDVPTEARIYVVATYDATGGGDPVLGININDDTFTSNDVSISITTGEDMHIGYNLNGNTVAGDQNWMGNISHMAFYTGDEAAAFIADQRWEAHYAAGTAPWQDDTPDERIGRILDIVEWPDELRELDSAWRPLQSAELRSQPALEHLQKVAETEFGLFFMSRSGFVRFISKDSQAVRTPHPITYGDGAGEAGYRAFSPEDAEETIRTRALISRLQGVLKESENTAATTEFGRFDYRLEGLLHRSDAYSQAYADYLVGEYAEPRRRVPRITLGAPPDGEESLVYPAMLGPELGDAITVSNTPIGGGSGFTQVCVVEGISHRGAPGKMRETTFELSPEFTEAPMFWEDYTPSNNNVTVGNGTQAARYARIGNTVFFEYQLLWGSSTAFAGTVDIGLPVPARDDEITVGCNINGQCVDANSTDYPVNGLKVSSGTRVRPVALGSGGGNISSTVPFTWTTGDFLIVAGTYEAA